MSTINPKRCYFREEWYQCVSTFQPADRLQIYEAVFNYTYYGQMPSKLSDINRGTFMLIKSMLDYDRASYDAKCTTNRQNGQKGGRPRLDGTPANNGFFRSQETQQNPTKPSITHETESGPHIQNITKTSTKQNINDTVFLLDGELKEEIKRKIFLNFWISGFIDPVGELQRFSDLYGSRGWVDANGNPIKYPIKLANLWKPRDVVTACKPKRKEFGEWLKSTPDVSLEVCRWFDRYEINASGSMVLYGNAKKLHDYFENQGNIKYLSAFVKQLGAKGLTYQQA